MPSTHAHATPWLLVQYNIPSFPHTDVLHSHPDTLFLYLRQTIYCWSEKLYYRLLHLTELLHVWLVMCCCMEQFPVQLMFLQPNIKVHGSPVSFLVLEAGEMTGTVHTSLPWHVFSYHHLRPKWIKIIDQYCTFSDLCMDLVWKVESYRGFPVSHHLTC